MRSPIKWSILASLLFALAGCAGMEQPQGVNDWLASAAAQRNGAIVTLTDLCKREVLSPNTCAKGEQASHQAGLALKGIAYAGSEGIDLSTPAGRLVAAQKALVLLQGYIASANGGK